MHDDANGIPREIFKEASAEVDIDDVSLVDSLKPEQRDAYEEIMSDILIQISATNTTES
jgi:hypothetical protein